MAPQKLNPNDTGTIPPGYGTSEIPPSDAEIQAVVRAVYAPIQRARHNKEAQYRAAKYAHERSPWPGAGTLYRK
jgi:hypothetical protein